MVNETVLQAGSQASDHGEGHPHGVCLRGMLALLCCLLVCSAQGQEIDAQVGDIRDGSLSGAVHHINLYTEKGRRISPTSNFDQPYSPSETCGQCHDVDTISQGWHFTPAADANAAGRPGEPWIYVDIATATQIPLSHTPWPGTFQPADLGISDWNFIRLFGRHMTGGGPGVHDANTVVLPGDRWGPSGSLEINCLTCHSAELMHDQSVVSEQIARQNYRWSATATASFGYVKRSARRLRDNYQLGDTARAGPQVSYDESRFFADNKIFLKLDRDVANERCYFCHSTKVLSHDAMDNLQDVHMASGIACVTCHGHGLDHKIRRGDETEARETGNVSPGRFSCVGCHLPEEGMERPRAGQFTAPRPEHKGLPPIHFEKLSCTACHSGPWPRPETVMGKTSRSHALGTHGANPVDDRLPYVQLPVFAPGHDGKLQPHRLIWPAYWASVAGDDVVPLSPDAVKEAAGDLIPHQSELTGPSWPEMDSDKVKAVLETLAASLEEGRKAGYVSGGKLFSIEGGEVVSQRHVAGEPYLWPLAHNVRPARQALGIRGCEDCHAQDAPFLFGAIAVDGPLVDPNERVSMTEFGGMDVAASRRFAATFGFRPLFKLVASASCVLMGLVLFWLVMRVLDGLIGGSVQKRE